jgi:hypothetical protein
MNYTKHYNFLIERAKLAQHIGYTERHHIVPRCMGGTDDVSNLVKLLPAEHYVAHQLLVKMHPGNVKLVHAAIMMGICSSTHQRNNKTYAWLREKFSKQQKIAMAGSGNPSFGKYWYHCPATLDNGKFLPARKPANWVKGKTPRHYKRLCKACNVYVDTVLKTNSKSIYCNGCKISERKPLTLKHEFELINTIYKEAKRTKQGYYTISKKYGINKWTIYDYIARYKDRLEK